MFKLHLLSHTLRFCFRSSYYLFFFVTLIKMVVKISFYLVLIMKQCVGYILNKTLYFTYPQELKNHPAFMTDIDWSKPLPPEIEGLMQLKYETANPTGNLININLH